MRRRRNAIPPRATDTETFGVPFARRPSMMPFQGDVSMGRSLTQGDAIGGCRRRIACPGLISDAASRRARRAASPTQRGPGQPIQNVWRPVRPKPPPDAASRRDRCAADETQYRPGQPIPKRLASRSPEGRQETSPGQNAAPPREPRPKRPPSPERAPAPSNGNPVNMSGRSTPSDPPSIVIPPSRRGGGGP